MKSFKKFCLLAISLFVVVGVFDLSAGKPFFEEFTLDVYGFLAVMQFIIPAFAYVYVYEKILVYKKIDLKKLQTFNKISRITYGLIFVVSYVFSFLLLYFVTGKMEYLKALDIAISINYFVILEIALDIHEKTGSIPIFRFNEKPIYYLKFFCFLILGVCGASVG